MQRYNDLSLNLNLTCHPLQCPILNNEVHLTPTDNQNDFLAINFAFIEEKNSNAKINVYHF